MFSKVVFIKIVKTWDCAVKGYIHLPPPFTRPSVAKCFNLILLFMFRKKKCGTFNPLNLHTNKILDMSKLKAFADDKTVSQKLKFALGRVENIVGKGENTGKQNAGLFVRFVKSLDYMV